MAEFTLDPEYEAAVAELPETDRAEFEARRKLMVDGLHQASGNLLGNGFKQMVADWEEKAKALK